MRRDSVIRGLRIAWSVAFGILCVLLVVLWVRSYWQADALTLASHLKLSSADGCIQFQTMFAPYSFKDDWAYSSWRMRWPPYEQTIVDIAEQNLFRFRRSSMHGPGLVPYWLAVCIAATLAAAPWIRYSLRTLLIATTAVAVILGLVVYATR
jgi:hypothetical protein